jgi:hypothetical protein
MTTVYVITEPGKEHLADITKEDTKIVDVNINVIVVNTSNDPWEQLKSLTQIKFEPGDIFCLAGLCPRRTTFDIARLAADRNENYMPGVGVDHRGVVIESGKIQHRLPIENNNYTVWPYLGVVGNPDDANISFQVTQLLSVEVFWPEYIPEVVKLVHLLAAVSGTGTWYTPSWFKVVDMSIRDLELAPVMYSSHKWHDWIAFYPANGNFKLENHSQLLPVWLDESDKPLEYWKRG